MNKLDQFFRDKLKEEEIIPAHDSWDKVLANLEGPAEKKEKLPFYWMAASMAAILFCSWFFINQGGQDTQDQMAEVITVEQPTEAVLEPIEVIEKQENLSNTLETEEELINNEPIIDSPIIVPSKKNKVRKSTSTKASKTTKKPVLLANSDTSNESAVEKKASSISTEAQDIIQTSITAAETSIVEAPTKIETRTENKALTRSTITITYKKSNSQTISDSPLVASSDSNAKEKKRKLTKVITFAADLASGEVWSDLRGAKDDLLSFNSSEETLNQ